MLHTSAVPFHLSHHFPFPTRPPIEWGWTNHENEQNKLDKIGYVSVYVFVFLPSIFSLYLGSYSIHIEYVYQRYPFNSICVYTHANAAQFASDTWIYVLVPTPKFILPSSLASTTRSADLSISLALVRLEVPAGHTHPAVQGSGRVAPSLPGTWQKDCWKKTQL